MTFESLAPLLFAFALGFVAGRYWNAQHSTAANRPTVVYKAPVPEDVPDVTALVREGRLIEAIKIYRQTHGVGLKEAKDAVDAIRDELERRGG